MRRQPLHSSFGVQAVPLPTFSGLQSGVHVVVGTPGRVYDMLRRRALRPEYIKIFSLDEADEMLSRGFKDQIYDIFQMLPPKLQACTLFAPAP